MPGNNIIDSELPIVFSIAYGIFHAYWRTFCSMLPCSSVDLGGTSVDIMVNQALVMQVAQYRFRNMSDLSNAFCFRNDTQLCVSMGKPEADETFVLSSSYCFDFANARWAMSTQNIQSCP